MKTARCRSTAVLLGCYLHGLFASDVYRRAFLARLRPDRPSGLAYEDQIERTLDLLAEHLEAHLTLDRLLATASIATAW